MAVKYPILGVYQTMKQKPFYFPIINTLLIKEPIRKNVYNPTARPTKRYLTLRTLRTSQKVFYISTPCQFSSWTASPSPRHSAELVPVRPEWVQSGISPIEGDGANR